jgi:hypothetical protein
VVLLTIVRGLGVWRWACDGGKKEERGEGEGGGRGEGGKKGKMSVEVLAPRLVTFNRKAVATRLIAI